MREDYLKQAQKVIQDPNILINVVSKRVKQLKFGAKPTVESLEKLEPEDVALLEIIKGRVVTVAFIAINQKCKSGYDKSCVMLDLA